MNKELKIVQMYVYDGEVYTYDDLVIALTNDGELAPFDEWLEDEYTIAEVFDMSAHERENVLDTYDEHVSHFIQWAIEGGHVVMLRCIDDGQF